METQHGIVRRPAPSESERAAYVDRAVECLPEEGTHFLGFHLVSELGRGAFSRVFLARQTELCNREVALKISVDLFNESQTLAQLQHTNIVPIYSAHSAGPLLALCMPYFGRTTLADVLKALQAEAMPESGQFLTSMLRGTLLQGALSPTRNDRPAEAVSAGDRLPLKRLEKLSYIQAVLWIGGRLAEGLAHAHERGIIHRDLKPANILLGDDGQPMLLDFNLSEDVKLPAADTSLGGTLPYMAPEQLDAFQGGRQPVDARSDIFSLGVILYEMLTARLPYPMLSGPLAEIMPRLAVERSSPAPRLRPWNRTVSPAVEAIVRRCLAPDPARRYQNARDLAEDIERHLDNRPLRHVPEPSLKERLGKWLRRHPRLKSPATLVAVAVIGLAIVLVPAIWLAWQEDRDKTSKERVYRARVEQRAAARAAAKGVLDEFREKLPTAKRLEWQLLLTQLHHGDRFPGSDDLKDDVTAARRVLDLFQVLDSPWQDNPDFYNLPAEEQDPLRQEVADLLLWLANGYRYRLIPPGKGVTDAVTVAWDLNQRAEACFLPDRVPAAILIQKAKLADKLGKKEAKEILVRAQKTPLKTARDYCAAGFELAAVRKIEDAVAVLKKGIAKDPDHFPSQLLLAVCRHNLARYGPQAGRLEEAAAAYTTCIALKPSFVPAYLHRGQVYLSDPLEKSWELARADADMVLRQRPDWIAARIVHARALLQEAKDRWDSKPPDVISIAVEKERKKILSDAIQELDTVLKTKSELPDAYYYRGKAYQVLKDEGRAAADFAKLLQIKPIDADGWSFRARARLERESPPTKPNPEKTKLAADALADLEQALALDPAHLQSLFQKARILADWKGQNKDALLTLNRVIEMYPDYLPALGQRGLVHARLGEWLKAYDDVIRLLDRSPDPAHHYQAAKIYALTSKFQAWDRPHALKQLSFALRNGHGWERFQTDPDLESLRGEPEYQKLVQIAPILARRVPPRMRPPEKEKR